jgi:nucleoside-diphosphate-sugar epimerase
MKTVLLLGTSSFVGKGLYDKLTAKQYMIDCFVRGEEESRIGNHVLGNIVDITSNPFFRESYDTVINLAYIKKVTFEQTLNYIKALIEFCKNHHVNILIHFSSISVYDAKSRYINEASRIDICNKNEDYKEIKIAVDEYLLSVHKLLPFELIFIRPGFVIAEDRQVPYIKQLPLGISIIKGNKRSKTPVVRREDIHKALLTIMENESNREVYLFLPSDNITKYQYAKINKKCRLIITLPEWLFKGLPFLLFRLRIISLSLYRRFESMYIKTFFDSRQTEEKLKIKF